jgi:AcrR family transcriptional regulator
VEDRRIRKTKQELKDAMLALLDEKPFEKISVTELCEKASVSRITFYTHYGSKYDLVNEYFDDMEAWAEKRFQMLQEDNNPRWAPNPGFCNMFDAIIDMYMENYNFFKHIMLTDNQYLFFQFYKYLLENVEGYVSRYKDVLKPKYSLRRVASFLCIGMWGFVRAGIEEKDPPEKIRGESRELIGEMMRSGLLSNPL